MVAFKGQAAWVISVHTQSDRSQARCHISKNLILEEMRELLVAQGLPSPETPKYCWKRVLKVIQGITYFEGSKLITFVLHTETPKTDILLKNNLLERLAFGRK